MERFTMLQHQDKRCAIRSHIKMIKECFCQLCKTWAELSFYCFVFSHSASQSTGQSSKIRRFSQEN